MTISCPNCQSEDVQKRGKSGKARRYQCNTCKKWFRNRESIVDTTLSNTQSYFSSSKDTGEIGFRSPIQITTLEELITQCKIDTDYWEIERWVCNKWEVGANSKDGFVVQPLYQVKAWLKRRTAQIRDTDNIRTLIDDAKLYAPKYPKLQYKKHKDGLLYEIQFPDVHFGRLTWHEESGYDYDIKIARNIVSRVVTELVGYSRQFINIKRILLPIGNDFFNVNNKANVTVHGTPQQEDTRWQKTFRAGRELLVEMIDLCSTVAPVDVIIVPGNHDEERMFYLGDALESWYHNNPNVFVDNRAQKRTYYKFEKVLLGFTHGYYEKIEKLPILMALEASEAWAETEFREWHLGDKHHKKDMFYRANEDSGVVIRVLRALAPPDAWTYDKGFVGAERAAEAFLWHPTNGLIAQFTAIAKHPNT